MRYRLRPDVSVSESDDGAVLLDERTGTYFRLNRAGSRLMERLVSGDAVDDVVRALQEQHPQQAQRIPADVHRLVDALSSNRLVECR